ncbi:MAG: chemotaxis protein CheX [Bacillota bacterium]|nr:chemotaxis protein CheX [Bacillota bacterium]
MDKVLTECFVKSASSIIKDITGLTFKTDDIVLKDQPCNCKDVVILIGITGKLRGNVVVNMTYDLAYKIAAIMLMEQEIKEMDMMSESAVCELCNMMMGNAATKLSEMGIEIDITPPTILTGQNIQYHVEKARIISIPFVFENNNIFELNISYKTE